MEIMGAEMEPDWKLFEGRYDDAGPATDRTPPDDAAAHWPGASQRLSAALRPSQDELDRVATSAPSPPKRFHYRSVAAELGWKAAKMLPTTTRRWRSSSGSRARGFRSTTTKAPTSSTKRS